VQLIRIVVFITALAVVLNASFIDNYFHTSQNTDTPAEILQDEYSDSFFEKARVGIEHSHFSDIEREYTLRLYTKDPFGMQVEKEIFNLSKNSFRVKEDIEKFRILKEKYLFLVKMIYFHQYRQIINSEITYLKQIMQKMRYSLDNESDIIAYDKKRTLLHEKELEMLQWDQKYRTLIVRLEESTGLEQTQLINELNMNLFQDDFTLIGFIKKDLEENNSSRQHPLFEYYNQKTRLEQNKEALLTTQEHIKLDNIEVKYDDSKKRKNALSLSVAFEVPFTHNSNKLLENKIKIYDAKKKAQSVLHEIDEKNRILTIDMQNLIAYYYEVENIYSDKINSANNISYKIYENKRKKRIKYEKEKLKTLYVLTQKYISYLYWSGKITSSSFYKFFTKQGMR